MMVVRPMYFKKDGVTKKRFYFVYDTDSLRYEKIMDRLTLVPNYAFEGCGSNVINEVRNHFIGKGMDSKSWRLSPPRFANISLLDTYLSGAPLEA